jgi:lysophospholipid acyltransferase (LPLAT)-like uncharacterized protein
MRVPKVAAAHWHGDELALITHFGRLGITLLVSQSKDGELMAKAAHSLGYRITRGSTTRGAVGGLLALIKSVRRGHSVVLAVDGPQGPRRVCKMGIVQLAQKTGVPLFPVGVATSHKYVFKKSWNQAYLTLPFSRQVILVDKPLFFLRTSDPEKREQYRLGVEKALDDARCKAERMLEDWK